MNYHVYETVKLRSCLPSFVLNETCDSQVVTASIEYGKDENKNLSK